MNEIDNKTGASAEADRATGPSGLSPASGSSRSGIPSARDLRAAHISGGPRPWCVINGNGPFGDEIVAGYLSEADALVCLAALRENDSVTLRRVGAGLHPQLG